MGFSRQEYWSGLPFPSPGDLPDPGIEPRSPTLQADALTSEPPGKPIKSCQFPCNTSIFPIQKPSGEYQFVQHLQAVSEAVITIHPLVTNPYPLLIQVPGNIQYFSVLDLKDAFFSILYIQTLNTFLPLNGGTLTPGG